VIDDIGDKVIGMGKPNFCDRNLLWCLFVHHKPCMNCPEIELRLRGEKPVCNRGYGRDVSFYMYMSDEKIQEKV
jgi:hypothetical protein